MRNKHVFTFCIYLFLTITLSHEAVWADGKHSGKVHDPHAQVYKEDMFPSATKCATCHQEIFDEWKISSHAYASISPMFNKFEQRINDLTRGTINNFCVRCHASVGTTMGEPRWTSIWKRKQVAREGITCVTCHRISEEFGKVNGERRIHEGDIHHPMYGAGNGKNLKDVIAKKDHYKVAEKKTDMGMPIHSGVIRFNTIKKSEFCMGCHQVAVHPGIKLEVVWDQYRGSPAFKEGITCQQCHMGKDPGLPSGYATGHVATINGEPIGKKRSRHNHIFWGPGYPITHPGLFPYNEEAQNWEIKEWLEFNYRSSWGKEDWEAKVEKGEIKPKFPEAWSDVDDRMDARKIIDENIGHMRDKAKYRRQLMNNGSKIDGPFFSGKPERGESLSFYYKITNKSTGHNLPSGSLGAQPQIWVNVALVDPSGRNVWESGYLDSVGDIADLHSEDVIKGKLAHDDQLVNFQSKFLTTNIKGTDREMYLPVNFDGDQLPFIRPANAPNSLLNHPAFVRMEGRSIPPLGYRKAKYTIPAKHLRQKGKYKLSVRLRSRAEPIYFMKFVYATQDMIRSMNEWIADVHPYTVEFEIK